ncbi:Uma2 family endonuclease [Sphaerospermopsis sp. LEGE 08334]|jgi:Uma2 family endonuclease|uniref:Uma2 family endonuclease n=1 Tax=Sphaerospermopsis sp. LEGE 08334 TaxID=1828651 RepID=UPI00187F6131|nr:Uma2 family endonuclease [Sphaerospermopsis sp. LEGE 08334]MBE9055804.1 Uma2 family endonuclease [Sphaerospermopsis sp. LEGE 08334]
MIAVKNRADRVVLYDISWQQFENILQNLGQSRAATIAYDSGTLEIMTPLPEHEHYKEVISDLVKDIADTLDLDYESYGSTTWKRETRLAGLESDNCFYLQNEAKVRGKLDLDLTQDPPPDLALEIDITSKSLNRFPIYARLGVPEIWCYDAGKLKIYLLENGEYIESETSLVFPGLPIRELPKLIEEHRNEGRRAIRKAVKNWVNNQRIL